MGRNYLANTIIILALYQTICITGQYFGPSDQPEAYFNGSSYVRLQTTISLTRQTGLSFRTCIGGELISQQLNENLIELSVHQEGLRFVAKTSLNHIEELLHGDYINNRWHTVYLVYRLGNLTLSIDDKSVLLANVSYQSELLTNPGLYNDGAVLIVGKQYNGCILEGPSITFNKTIIQSHGVQFGKCPISENSCNIRQDFKMGRAFDPCLNEPCMMHGKCINEGNSYTCVCSSRYTGKNCEFDIGNPCEKNPPLCKNGATCNDDLSGNYKCVCSPEFTGTHCEKEIKVSQRCKDITCMNNGNCQINGDDQWECVCQPGFSGIKCEKNINECQTNPCKNGGICNDQINNYTCQCANTGYTGPTCEDNQNECILSKPCLNNGVCFDTYGGYMCECMPGFDGQNCDVPINECKSHPCMNHGQCEDTIYGGFECHCLPGYGGQYCELELRKSLCDSSLCPQFADCKDISGVPTCTCKSDYSGIYPNCIPTSSTCLTNTCLNGGICTQWMGNYNCTCPPGFSGTACEVSELKCSEYTCKNGGICIDEGNASQCICNNGFSGKLCEQNVNCSGQPCTHVYSCKDYPGGYYCNCEPGWTGWNCDVKIDECMNKPCLNGGTCIDLLNKFKCQCKAGYSGERCQLNLDDCLKMPCKNGGTCINTINGYFCNCTDQWMGPTCERPYNVCDLKPCIHNGTCINTHSVRNYTCKCINGYEGKNCEHNIDDCLDVKCSSGKICVDMLGTFECQCPPGYGGDSCTLDADPCLKNPCQNMAQCVPSSSGHNYTCNCPSGYAGFHCDVDINECEDSKTPLCNHGICVNKEGGYQCYCMPGYTGERCNLDFDECLSQPCKNNASCINKVNNYECRCTPGYEGKDCDVNIDECASHPCMEGSTCLDGINEYTCVCQPGLTGKQCKINIDDCESSPCLHGSKCIDGLNMFQCDCSNTGYKGEYCDINIDDCIGDPCENGANCIDAVNDYKCECHKGYMGKNCEEDINECEINPCMNNGICLERSNLTLYQLPFISTLNFSIPSIFKKKFNYYDAAGYECVCVPGIVGENCEVNINDCESSPCLAGNCQDRIGGYYCECDEGFEGEQCEIDIDECEKLNPCMHGMCIDKKANYFCDCDSNYGGKNCSEELTGCRQNPCHNNGTCKPYLDNETQHKFNCTCPHGFHGQTCDRVTTMSLSGHSLMVVNTSRDEGHDIQFRFKTTLGDGFLALGKGSTFYILSLAKGRLNLHSSLLNKWDGVFVGSNLNDSNWQRVFVAINSSHLVLSANDEQTIYPINYNDNNGSSNSFPTTYIGGYPKNYRSLTNFVTNVQQLVGCFEDVIVNGEWVLPDTQNSSWVGFQGVNIGCQREPQCTPNPCYSGGHCTDLWSNFSCSCERPYLGYTCEYNYTAATFGYEKITDSLVTVSVNDAARRAVRSIVDISMFIRTREPRGQIFYLGSALGSVNLQNESYIAAQLEGGELLVRIQFNGTIESYTVGGVRLNNGHNHLIEVIRNVTLVQVKLNGTEYFRKTISATGTLDAQVLFLGGQPPLRPVRQTSDITTGKTADVTASSGPAAVTTPLSMIHFKGIIQDVQISDGNKIMVVEFFPLQAEELSIPNSFGNVTFDNTSVLEGVLSDDSCQTNPCHHNGVCINTWNDYRCDCPRGFKGKQCKDLEFCELDQCPEGSECKNLEDGFECISNATFNGETSPLTYNLTTTKAFVADSIEVNYRTRSWGTALFAQYLENNFIIFIFHDEVIVEWNFSGVTNTKRFKMNQFDGQWITLLFKFKDNVFKGGFKEHVLDDTPEFSVADFDINNFTEIFIKGNVYLGGSDNKTFDYWKIVKNNDFNGTSYVTLTDSTTLDPLISNAVDFLDNSFPSYKIDLNKTNDKFKGCLGEVRIGTLVLPYFTKNEIYTKGVPPNSQYFQLYTESQHSIGCKLCYEKDCYNSGTCIDPYKTYKCNCPLGYAADDCSIDINECEDNMCKNNSTCIDLIGRYECQCILGYEGLYCETEIDECASNPCHHGGTCIDLLGMYRCECPEEFVGKQCEALRIITCDNQPCKDGSTCENIKKDNNNFTCICSEGMVGILCDTPFCNIKSSSCQNGGICNTTEIIPHCDCPAGYKGFNCEVDINECILTSGNSPCQNGGECIDGVNRYDCSCLGTGHTGLLCEIDIDECTENEATICGNKGHCENVPGSYKCHCFNNTMCGHLCNLKNPCNDKPCENNGECSSNCTDERDYICQCKEGNVGKNCTQVEVRSSQSNDGFNILYVAIPVVMFILLALAIGLAVLVNVARSKRATRGTYSPSAQEFCNPRVELDHVLKPPPEERLI